METYEVPLLCLITLIGSFYTLCKTPNFWHVCGIVIAYSIWIGLFINLQSVAQFYVDSAFHTFAILLFIQIQEKHDRGAPGFVRARRFDIMIIDIGFLMSVILRKRCVITNLCYGMSPETWLSIQWTIYLLTMFMVIYTAFCYYSLT